MSGYRFVASNEGGFTTHPCTRVPPLELYHSSSARASRLFASTSSFTLVSRTRPCGFRRSKRTTRSEEHTSELQSLAYLVCRLLLEKKKKKNMFGALCFIHVS